MRVERRYTQREIINLFNNSKLIMPDIRILADVRLLEQTIFDSYEDAKKYVKHNHFAYIGQVIYVSRDGKLDVYIISRDMGLKPLQLANFRKNKSGRWYDINTGKFINREIIRNLNVEEK